MILIYIYIVWQKRKGNEMKKRLLALSTAVVLTAGLFAGCGANEETPSSESKSEAPAAQEDSKESSDTSSDNADASGELEAMSFAGDIVGQGVPALDNYVGHLEYGFNAIGSEFSIFNDNFNADTQTSNIQTIASSDYDGCMVFGFNAAAYPSISSTLQQGQVPFLFYDQIPADESVIEALNKNEYYVGSVGVDPYEQGVMAAEDMLEAGIKTAMILGGSVGDVIHDGRTNGFTDTFEAGGGEVVAVARCSDPSEATAKEDDLLSANPDAEATYALTGDYAISALSALDNYSGREMVIYCSDITADALDLVKDGSIDVAYSGAALDTTIGVTLLYNAASGNKILDENGNPPMMDMIPTFKVTAELADRYNEVFFTGHPLDAETMKSLIGPDVTYQTYLDFFDNFSLETVTFGE
jgi:ABC-type sugar transport system substrate-binding protein